MNNCIYLKICLPIPYIKFYFCNRAHNRIQLHDFANYFIYNSSNKFEIFKIEKFHDNISNNLII